MKFSKKKYWDRFYSKKKKFPRSTFANFCKKKFIRNKQKNKKLIDLGCGNGRDTIFFSNKIYSFGVDRSEEAITNLQRKYSSNINLNFKKGDLENLNFKTLGKFDYIYCRFLFHAINKKIQTRIFNNLKYLMKKKCLLMVEFRTDKDPLKNFGKKISKSERYTNHYRRFINLAEFEKIIKKGGFKIKYKTEKKGLSIFNKDNPVLARLIFTKS